jgi:iron complex transport system substrate-binding protein
MRVISLAPSNTEILFALGLQKELVAVTSFCNFPAAAKNLPRLPGWSTIKAADVLEFKPDLVLTSTICQEALRREIEAAGLKIHHFDPRTLDAVAHSFIELGELFSKSKEGRSLSRDFHAELDSLKASAPERRSRVYVEEWDKPPMAAGNWVPEMLLAAGAEPFNRSLGELSQAISWEELMEFDPEVVIYSICGVGLHFDPSQLYSIEGWNTLNAAKQRRVYSIDDSYLNIPGPRLVEGVRLLRDLIDGRMNEKVRALKSL